MYIKALKSFPILRCLCRAKEYADAIEHYTLSLGFHANNPSVHANRAAAYLKIKMWDAAETDCTMALELDPKYLKAWIRRAACMVEMKRYLGGLAVSTAIAKAQSA